MSNSKAMWEQQMEMKLLEEWLRKEAEMDDKERPWWPGQTKEDYDGEGNPIAAVSKQVAGSHYKAKKIQPWEYISANDLDFFEGNVIKYITRYKDKGGVEDLQKAKHYIEYLIEKESK